jgi:hypothetical protein
MSVDIDFFGLTMYADAISLLTLMALAYWFSTKKKDSKTLAADRGSKSHQRQAWFITAVSATAIVVAATLLYRGQFAQAYDGLCWGIDNAPYPCSYDEYMGAEFAIFWFLGAICYSPIWCLLCIGLLGAVSVAFRFAQKPSLKRNT